jgi:hypothetical protein
LADILCCRLKALESHFGCVDPHQAALALPLSSSMLVAKLGSFPAFFFQGDNCNFYHMVCVLGAVYTRVFGVRCPVRDGAAAQQLPLLLSRDHVREKAKEAVG